MSTSPLPIDQFAAKVRSKYPGAYDHLSDAELVSKVVDKYPEYKDNIASYAKTEFEKQREGGPDRGFLSGLSSSLGTTPTLKEQIPRIMGPGFDVARGIYNTAKNAPANYQAGVQAANAATGGNAPPDVRAFTGAVSTLGPMLGLNPQSMAARAETGDTSGILGEAAIPTAMAALPLAKEATGGARRAIGGAIHTPEGAMTPLAKVGSQVGGAVVGGGVGEMVHPGAGLYAGGAAGYRAGPAIVEKLFPEPPSRAAARAAVAEQADILAEKQKRAAAWAEMNEDFAKKQAALDKEKLKAQTKAQVEAAKAAAKEREAVPVAQGPGPYIGPKRKGGMTPPPSPEVGAGIGAEGSRIIDPNNPPPLDYKVTYQSTPQAELLEKVKSGNTDAVREWVRRGLKLPENVRFLLDPTAGTKPWRNPLQ